MNFSKTILERSHLKDLFKFLKQRVLYEILCNYTIILRYQNDYIQVAGRPLNIDFNSMLNEKRKKNLQPSNRLANSDPYEFNIRRTLIFYCSHINRTSGIFHRSKFIFIQIFSLMRELPFPTAKNSLKLSLPKLVSNLGAI